MTHGRCLFLRRLPLEHFVHAPHELFGGARVLSRGAGEARVEHGKPGFGLILRERKRGCSGVLQVGKHAVVGLSRAAALEYAPQGIRVNAVAPGAIETEMYDRFTDEEIRAQINTMVPMGRTGTCDEVVSAILWLTDPANSYTTGQVIAVDGGFTAQ